MIQKAVKEPFMPGIIAHSKIFFDSLNQIKKNSDHSPFCRSLEVLFSSEKFLRAGLFGSLGPDIFDYTLIKKNRGFFGSDMTSLLHSALLEKSISFMIKRIVNCADFNNEWAAVQRAYLYGYVSHIITDAVFHPFVFYWAGFPDRVQKEEVYYYREQYLLFEYNMDLFFAYLHENRTYNFDINHILPMNKNKSRIRVLEPAIVHLLLETIDNIIPQALPKFFWKRNAKSSSDNYSGFGIIDIMPHLIKFNYSLKRNSSENLNRFLNIVKQWRIFFPDLTVRYPEPKKINRHVLNLHRERWVYPAGKTGIHYESVEDLYKIAREKIAQLLEKMESLLYSENKDTDRIIREVLIDAYTGETGKGPGDLKIKNPVRIRN